MHEVSVSFIICTRDRPQQLLRCVAAIAAAAERHPETATEIIVLENLSQPHLALDAGDVLDAAKGRGRFIKLMEGGLSKARNSGIRAARGQLFAFTDDDCIVDVNFLVDLARHTAQKPENLFIGGRVKLADLDDLPFTIKDEPEARQYDVSIHPGGFAPGCNFVISRATARLIGDFDIRFGAGALFRAGEDTDYIIRAHLAGIPIKYVPDMCVLHQHGRKQVHEIDALNRDYAFANGALYGKHIGQGWLLKHLYWSVRSAFSEAFGGPRFNTEIGLSWRSTVASTFAGFRAYFRPAKGVHAGGISVRSQLVSAPPPTHAAGSADG